MITSAEYGYKWNGLSTDDKFEVAGYFHGEGIPNGAKFLEMDTNKLYAFDAESQTWIYLPGGDPGSAYIAGNGIKIIGGEISIDEDVVATKEYVDTRFTVTDVIIDDRL